MHDDDTFELALGGRQWRLPPFTFGTIKHLQPRLLRINHDLFVDAPGEDLALRLDEARLDAMLDVVIDAIRVVDPQIARDALERLRFTPNDLVAAQRAVMEACGLIVASPEEVAEGASGPKARKRSTTSSPA